MPRQTALAEATIEATERVSAVVEAAEPTSAPYVGPRPFERNEGRFYGRDREVLDLMYLTLAHPVVLLYAESGAGKTSLVNAKLIPTLERKGCHVLPVARVRGTTYDLDPSRIRNIFAFHALANWTGLPRDQVPRLVRSTILGELKAISDDLARECDEEPQIVAVLDQFEELFTHYDHRWAERRGLFEQLGEALEAMPNLRVLFSMREDYIAGMDSFAPILPERLKTRYRLERLRRESALEAIRRPMEDVGRTFLPGVAERLVEDLLRIRVARRDHGAAAEAVDVDLTATYGQTPSGASSAELPVIRPDLHPGVDEFVLAEYIVPVQLQVVCQTLWEGLLPGDTTVTLAHVEKCGDINRALAGFYERCTRDAAAVVGLGEGKIRRWFEDKLITRMGTRKIVMREEDQTEGLPNAAVDFLDERHIVRSEDRGGVRWYELAHERFIGPIRESNQRWRSTRSAGILEMLEARALAWSDAPVAGKPSRLMTREELGRAEAWISGTDAADLGYSDRLGEYLKECRSALAEAEMRAQLEAERAEGREKARRARALTWGLAGLAALVLLTIVGWIASFVKGRNASVLERTAKAYYEAEQDPQKGLKVAVEAAELVAKGWVPDGSLDEHVSRALRHVLIRARLRTTIPASASERTDLDFHPDGRHVVFQAQDGSTELWDIGDPEEPKDDRLVDSLPPDITPEHVDRRQGRRVNHVIFDAPGDRIVVVCGNPANDEDGGSARIWKPAFKGRERTVIALPGHDQPVTEAAFSPDGRFVATASGRDTTGLVQIFDADNGRCAARIDLDRPVNCVGFSGDQLAVATGLLGSDKRDNPGRACIYPIATGLEDVRIGRPIEMKGYDRPVSHVVFSVDGKLVAAGCDDGTVRVFRVEDGRVVASLLGHSQPVVSLAFNRDGSRLVTASGDRTARVWEAGRWLADPGREWQSIATLSGHKSSLFYAEFSPDGTLVLTCSYDKTARLWDARTGEVLLTFPGHQGLVYTARFSTDGRLVATVSADKTARVWDVGQVEPPRALLSDHEAAVRDVAVDLRGRWALTASADGTAKLWRLSTSASSMGGTMTLARTLGDHTGPLTAAALHPRRDLAATASLDGTVRIWDCATGREVKRMEEGAAALGVTFSPSGRFLLTSWADGRMRLFAEESGWGRARDPWYGSAQRLSPKLFSANERVLVTPNAGLLRVKGSAPPLGRRDRQDAASNAGLPRVKGPPGSVHLRDLSNAAAPRAVGDSLPTPSPAADVAFGGDLRGDGRHLLAAALSDGLLGGSVRLWSWDGDVGKPADRPARDLPHQVGVERVAFHPDGRELVSESEGGIGLIWKLPLPTGDGGTAQPSRPLPGLTGPVPNLAYSPDGARLVSDGGRLATDSGDGPVRLWQASDTSSRPRVLDGRRASILSLTFTREDRPKLLTIDRENRFQRWDLDTRRPLELRRGPDFPATAAALSPDGLLALSGAADGTAQIWESLTGKKLADLKEKGHSNRISAVAFSPDGALVATASWDKTVRIWRARDEGPGKEIGTQVGVPIELNDFVNAVRFHPDPKRRLLAIATGDLKRARLQPAESGFENRAVACLIRPLNPASEIVTIDLGEVMRDKDTTDDAPFGVNAAIASPDGRRVYLACGGKDPANCVVHVYQHRDGRWLAEARFEGHTEPILALDMAPDGKTLVTASADNSARVWNAASHESLKELREHNGDVAGAWFHPGGRYVATISLQDGTARVWDATTGDRIYVLAAGRSGLNSATLNDLSGPRSFTDDVAAVAFGSDGKRLITANGDGRARVYTLEFCGPLEQLLAVAGLRSRDVVPEAGSAR